jgi:hypothetical protein
MKQLIIFVFAITFITSCNNHKNPFKRDDTGGLGGGGDDTKSNWTSKDRKKAMNDCVAEIPDNPQAKQICSCLLEKVEKKYPDPEDVDKKSSKEEIADMTRACLAGGGGGGDEDDNGFGRKKKINEDDDNGGGGVGWSKRDKNTFLGQCEDGLAQKGYATGKAQQLCSCVLEKLEKRYSSLDEGNEKGGNAAGAKAMQECLGDEGNNNDN